MGSIGLLGHVWQLACQGKGPMRRFGAWFLPIDDEIQLDAGTQSYLALYLAGEEMIVLPMSIIATVIIL